MYLSNSVYNIFLPGNYLQQVIRYLSSQGTQVSFGKFHGEFILHEDTRMSRLTSLQAL